MGSLTDWQLGLGAAAALLLFWTLGARRRLGGLQRALIQAGARLSDALAQRSRVALSLLDALREPLQAEAGALEALRVAHDESVRAASAIGQAGAGQAAPAWVKAESAVAAAASRVLALVDQHPALASQEPVAALLLAWREANDKLAFARQIFNEASAAYNAALGEIPTRLLARLLGLRRSGSV